MKAARLHAYGQLPRVEEVAAPVVSDPLDVVVRVGGAGLCRTDLHVVDGVFAYLAKPLPYVLGHETAGWVHEVGSAVVDLEMGIPSSPTRTSRVASAGHAVRATTSSASASSSLER